jgi:hypothetical protein
MTSRNVIGLDISTSCTGVCCLDSTGKIILIEPIVLTKLGSFVEKCQHVEKELARISKIVKIDEVYIEQNLSSFRRGLSSAHTINTLARFNGACDLISYKVFGKPAVSLNVTNARNHLKIKIDHKDKTTSTKEKVFSWVKACTDVDWPKKKNGDIKDICFDMADAYVIALAGLHGCKE